MNITRQDFEDALKVLKSMQQPTATGPSRLSVDGWLSILTIITAAVEYAMKELFGQGGDFQKPGFFKKLKLGGYFVMFVIKLVKLFKKS